LVGPPASGSGPVRAWARRIRLPDQSAQLVLKEFLEHSQDLGGLLKVLGIPEPTAGNHPGGWIDVASSDYLGELGLGGPKESGYLTSR